jgi:DNA-binding MarR family transcriptional regulator/GNAT superfamily N-acetyltransferase
MFTCHRQAFPSGGRIVDQIDRIRGFNRDDTRRIGLMNTTILGDMSFSEVRVLLEIAQGNGTATARSLCRFCGLDEGYVNRLIGRFESRDWIRRVPDPQDARRRLLARTATGQAVLDPIRHKARAAVGATIAHLVASGRADLISAMERIESLLAAGDAPPAAPTSGDIVLRDIRFGNAAWFVGRHVDLHASEGCQGDFEALICRIIADFLGTRDPACERGWIAEAPVGERLGCVICVRNDPHRARLRTRLVDPVARGLGLGQRLTSACFAFARAAGYTGTTLYTHRSQTVARHLYAAAGFRMTKATPGRAFGTDVIEETWEIDFQEV